MRGASNKVDTLESVGMRVAHFELKLAKIVLGSTIILVLASPVFCSS